MDQKPLIVGGACGFWGEASHSTAQLLSYPGLDFLIYDYLAEITMSIMARARAKDPALGHAGDFVSAAMVPNLAEIAAKGVRVCSNAGGLNPEACGAAMRAAVEKAGLDLKVAVITGDDLLDRLSDFAQEREMFSGEAFPDPDKVASANAYFGAFPIAAALDAGADIVITGRCVDSALALGAAIHHFGWAPDDLDALAGGSLAGHIVECGPQATGGNFTDWESGGDLADIGYPVAKISASGEFAISKPSDTTGLVSRATVAEQMLYEIGDPGAYALPDVTADFSQVVLAQAGPDHVTVQGARGRAPSGKLKVSTTWADGFRGGYLFNFNGRNAGDKARAFALAGLDRAQGQLRKMNAPVYTETSIEVSGGAPQGGAYEEVQLKAAVRHPDAKAVGLFLREVIGGALAAPPGLHGFTGAGRPKPSPVVRLFSFLADARDVPVSVTLDGSPVPYAQKPVPDGPPAALVPEPVLPDDTELVPVALEDLAWARSGDKGDAANVGVIARNPAAMPYIWHALDAATIRAAIPFAKGEIQKFYLPGSHSMNILMADALGGGGIASLLNDAQGKGYAQRLLAVDIPVPIALANTLETS